MDVGIRSQESGVRIQGAGVKAYGTGCRGQDSGCAVYLVPNNLRRLAVAAAQQAPGLTRPLVLQLPRGVVNPRMNPRRCAVCGG